MLCCDKKSVKMNKNTYKNPHFGGNGHISWGGGVSSALGTMNVAPALLFTLARGRVRRPRFQPRATVKG